MNNSAQLIDKDVYMNQLPSVALNNADLKKEDELTFVSSNTKEEEGRRPYTTLTYMRKADNKRIRLSLSVLDGMTNNDGQTLPEESGYVKLPDSITILGADDTDRYSIRDYEDNGQNMEVAQIANATGKQALGGGVLVGITLELINDWRIAFSGWTGPTTQSVSVGGGNLVEAAGK